MTKEEVKVLEARLTAHYGEPVRPVSHYCNAFYTFREALRDALKRGDFHEEDRNQYASMVEAFDQAEVGIRKSNLLYRLIYLGEPIRTKKCPEHDGRWSGYRWPDDEQCGCESGYDITGWLP